MKLTCRFLVHGTLEDLFVEYGEIMWASMIIAEKKNSSGWKGGGANF